MECNTGSRPERPPPPPPPTQRQAQPRRQTTQDDRITNITNFHDEAYLYIEQGLSCDELGQTEQATFLYKKAITSIDKAVEINSNATNKQGASWEIVHQMIIKMIKTKAQMSSRIDHLLTTDAAAARGVTDPPPSYEAATSIMQTDDTFDSIMNDNELNASQESLANATELFCIEDGVQIFFITPEGYVSAPSYPSALVICKLDQQQAQCASNMDTPPAFLKVGDWMYPLLPGSSPVLRADWGAYIFPDVTASQPGNTIPNIHQANR